MIELNEDEKRLVAEGNIIPAIKALRYRFNLDLRMAKDVVDKYRDYAKSISPIMSKDLVETFDTLKELWLGLFDAREHEPDPINMQGHMDRLARGVVLIERLEKKYGLPHFDFIDGFK